jgi:xylose dehydrogenase (NAD/NADP)
MSLESYFDSFTERDWSRMQDTEPVRFALVGLGWWVQEQAMPAIEGSDFCETSVLVSRSAEKAAEAAAGLTGVDGISADAYHAGEHADSYDAVYVCTPNATHLEYVESAAAQGKAVLCEKPMEASSERAERLVAACDEADVPLYVAYRMHTEPAVRRAKDLIDEGFIGDPVQVHGGMSGPLLDINPDEDQWRLSADLAGGCAMMDIGIYPLNTTRFLLDADPEAVYGVTHTVHPAFEEVDEHVGFHVTFPDNVSAACTASHGSYMSSHLRILGTEGELLLDPIFYPWHDREITVRGHGTSGEISFEQANQMTEEFDYFATCVRTDTEPVATGRHGLVDVRAIEAVYESAETGERVTL